MTRRERLLATLRGEPVDRPAVNFPLTPPRELLNLTNFSQTR